MHAATGGVVSSTSEPASDEVMTNTVIEAMATRDAAATRRVQVQRLEQRPLLGLLGGL